MQDFYPYFVRKLHEKCKTIKCDNHLKTFTLSICSLFQRSRGGDIFSCKTNFCIGFCVSPVHHEIMRA